MNTGRTYFKKGSIPWNKGIRQWEGKIPPRLGIKHTEAAKEKNKIAHLGIAPIKPAIMFGKDNPAWKGGITPINKLIRESVEYDQWRIKIFERDLYTCQHCGQVGGYLEADHIKPFAYYPKLRFELSNGRTLCKPCHKKTDTYAGRAKILSQERRI